MGQVRFIVPRLVIGYFDHFKSNASSLLSIYAMRKRQASVFLLTLVSTLCTCRVVIQLLCSYSTLPLYAIVTQVRQRSHMVCLHRLLS